jgi:DNA-binding MarR family transcriptional regulator
MPQTDAMAEELMEQLGPLIAGERSLFAQRCHERSISMGHLHLITLLEEHGPMPMGRIAELLGSALPNVTGMADRMVERGLVERTRDATDRRVVMLSLTPQGVAQLRQLTELRRQRLGAALTQLTVEQRTTLLQSIKNLRAAFERVLRQGESIS